MFFFKAQTFLSPIGPCVAFLHSSSRVNTEYEILDEIDGVYGNALLPAVLNLQGIIY